MDVLSGLEEKYDIIICGTGLAESFLASSLAIAGKSVLHLDINDYYGSNWGGLTLNQLHNRFSNSITKTNSNPENLDQDRVYVPIGNNKDYTNVDITNNIDLDREKYKNILYKYISNSNDYTNNDYNNIVNIILKYTLPQLFSLSFQFSLDLTPKFVYSASKFINIILNTKLTHYLEFRGLGPILYYNKEKSIISSPATKSELFQCEALTLVEKMLMMKLIETVCISNNNSEILSTFSSKPFIDLLKEFKLTPLLIDFIFYCICFLNRNDNINTMDAVQKMLLYFNSLARFNGKNALLYLSFGIGELIQSLCRLCAVFGGIYVLRTSPDFFVFDKKNTNCIGISIQNKLIYATLAVISNLDYSYNTVYKQSAHYFHNISHSENMEKVVSRCICITSSPPFNNTEFKDTSQYLIIPPNSISFFNKDGTNNTNKHVITLISHSSSSQCTPSGHFITYLLINFPAQEELHNIVHNAASDNLLFEKESLLYCVFYDQIIRSGKNIDIKDFYSTPDPDSSNNFEEIIPIAEQLYKSILTTNTNVDNTTSIPPFLSHGSTNSDAESDNDSDI